MLKNKPSWSGLRLVLISLLLFLIVLSNLAWHPAPVSGSSRLGLQVSATPSLTPVKTQSVTEEPVEKALAPVHTLLPAEYLNNSQQTTGIIFVASMMVMIVVAGVLYSLLTEKRKS